MTTMRFILALFLTIAGCAIVVRMLALGIHPEIFPGVLLGAAMVALGVHKMTLIRRVIVNRKVAP
jgi:hypothetical protein